MPAFVAPARTVAALALAALAGLVSAAQPEPRPAGTDGLAALPFAARNLGPQPMACTVATAHWYSVELGTAAPGARVVAMLWATPATGEVVLLNTHGERMPVESLWCGVEGRAWITRATIPLERQAGRWPLPLRFDCRAGKATLHCEPSARHPRPRSHTAQPSTRRELD